VSLPIAPDVSGKKNSGRNKIFVPAQEKLKLKLARKINFDYNSGDGPDATALFKIFGDRIRT